MLHKTVPNLLRRRARARRRAADRAAAAAAGAARSVFEDCMAAEPFGGLPPHLPPLRYCFDGCFDGCVRHRVAGDPCQQRICLLHGAAEDLPVWRRGPDDVLQLRGRGSSSPAGSPTRSMPPLPPQVSSHLRVNRRGGFQLAGAALVAGAVICLRCHCCPAGVHVCPGKATICTTSFADLNW